MTESNRKKVLFLITKSNWGGAQRYVYDLATNLNKEQFEPVVAMGGDGVLSDMLHNAGIRTITLNELKNSTSLRAAWAAGRELRDIIRHERPAVFHVNSSTAGLIGTIVGRLTRVSNIIFTAHGWAFNEDRPFWQRVLIKGFHWLTVLLSHRTIAVSSAIVQQMNWPGAQRKMKIINPGRTIGPMYERTEARTKITDFCPRLTPYQKDRWLVCIAELHLIKRHTVLIEAMSALVKQYPTLRLIFIGEGQERAALQQKTADQELDEHIFFTGAVTEAARFLKGFDIFVLASKSESYGYVLHEAGLAGLPVVATNVGGIPDIIKNGQNGLLVSTEDAGAIERAIVSLLDNNEKKDSLAKALLLSVSDKTVARMTLHTSAIYNERL